MGKFHVWLKDEFLDCDDADERSDRAMELNYTPNDYTIRRVGRVLHHPYPVDDAKEAAEVYADFYHSQRDGWECTWPIAFVVYDGDCYVVIEVMRDFDPVFHAGKPEPLALEDEIEDEDEDEDVVVEKTVPHFGERVAGCECDLCRELAATRDCTCLGTCKGADGLGPGWRCVMAPMEIKEP